MNTRSIEIPELAPLKSTCHIYNMRFALISVLVLSGCAQFPDLNATVDPAAQAAEFPDLIPIETILAEPERRTTSDADPAAEVSARAARLRARAARLRSTVVDQNTRTRMATGVRSP